jgi:signal transduction histidine kinase
MRLKTKLVIAISALVVAVASVLSLVYLDQLLEATIHQSYASNLQVAREVRFALQLALEAGLKDRVVDPNDPNELRTLAAQAVRSNDALLAMMNAVNRYSPTVYDINIGDSADHILLTTGATPEDMPLPTRPSFDVLLNGGVWKLLRVSLGPPQVYELVLPIERNGKPFVSVHVGVRTSLLRAQYAPWIQAAISLMGLALITALVAALLLSNLALKPMEELSERLDYWTRQERGGLLANAADKSAVRNDDAVARVSSKIEQIGQRMRTVEDVYTELKDNVEQVLGKLQDGLMLFAADGRVVLASEAATRMLERSQGQLVGHSAEEIFAADDALDVTIRTAWKSGQRLMREEVIATSGRRIAISLEFIANERSERGLGALLKLHDPEPAEAIESELEVSRRLSAIGRLTAGVGHEVKNPINAIVVHLELLRNRMGSGQDSALRHLNVIQAEIQRLDRVVQTLADFSRPVEIQRVERDLRTLVDDVVLLTEAQYAQRGVRVVTVVPDHPVMVKIDSDLMKQALLNVTLNGAQAMPEGGTLTLELNEGERRAMIRVHDEGVGIPQEMLGKIFDLYYTTKKEGSGIGLAMTYRILQLHQGEVLVKSVVGRGTEIEMRIPLSTVDRGRQATVLPEAAESLL